MKSKQKIIGILGGMGPGASGYLYNLVNAIAVEKYGITKNEDFPETILYSVPVPDFISSSRNRNVALAMLQERVKKLNTFSIGVMGIACNTAHILLPNLQRISHARIISMIDEVCNAVLKKNPKKVGLLATSSTIRAGLYQSILEKRGITVVVPTKINQRKIDSLIKGILKGQIGSKQEKRLVTIANELVHQKVEILILGCTELPLFFPKKYSCPVLNSVEILAEAMLKASYGEKSLV